MSTRSMSTVHRSARRLAALAVLVPLTAVVVVGGAAPASAVPFEGEPTQNSCLRLVSLPEAGPAGSTLFVSHGKALVLRSGAEC